jgi:hypothetical protein
MTEQTMAVCQVVMSEGLLRSAWEDLDCEMRSRKFPKDPLRIPFDDPSPQVDIFYVPVGRLAMSQS